MQRKLIKWRLLTTFPFYLGEHLLDSHVLIERFNGRRR
jgi:hypothetical protein